MRFTMRTVAYLAFLFFFRTGHKGNSRRDLTVLERSFFFIFLMRSCVYTCKARRLVPCTRRRVNVRVNSEYAVHPISACTTMHNRKHTRAARARKRFLRRRRQSKTMFMLRQRRRAPAGRPDRCAISSGASLFLGSADLSKQQQLHATGARLAAGREISLLSSLTRRRPPRLPVLTSVGHWLILWSTCATPTVRRPTRFSNRVGEKRSCAVKRDSILLEKKKVTRSFMHSHKTTQRREPCSHLSQRCLKARR